MRSNQFIPLFDSCFITKRNQIAVLHASLTVNNCPFKVEEDDTALFSDSTLTEVQFIKGLGVEARMISVNEGPSLNSAALLRPPGCRAIMDF